MSTIRDKTRDDDFTQLSIGDFVKTRQRPDRDGFSGSVKPLEQRYYDWRGTENGQAVFAAVLKRALRLRRAGWKRYGIAAIFEVVRYSYDVVHGPDAEGFKLNNSYRSRLARELMDRVPELDDFFEIRELKS